MFSLLAIGLLCLGVMLNLVVLCCVVMLVLGLLGDLLSFLRRVVPPMFVLLADAAGVVLVVVAVEHLAAVDADHGAWRAPTPDMIVHLLLLERDIAVLAHEGHHPNKVLLIF